MIIGAYPSEVVRIVCALLSPFIALFGLYIIAHGHYGPGGGFAGGVFLAVGAILPRLTLPERLAFRLVPSGLGPLACGVGLLLFLVIGTVPLLVGGAFLDYGAVQLGAVEAARVRYLGILVVEVAVGLAVFGAMVMIFDVLASTVVPAGGSPYHDTTFAREATPRSTAGAVRGGDATSAGNGAPGTDPGQAEPTEPYRGEAD